MSFGTEGVSTVSNAITVDEMTRIIIPLFEQSGVLWGKNIATSMGKLIGRYFSIDAVDELYGSNFLTQALNRISDTAQFEEFLRFFLMHGGDINQVNQKNGTTVLDGCDYTPSIVPDYAYRRALLIGEGARPGAEVSDIARRKAAEPILSGWSGSSMFGGWASSAAAYRGFSFEDRRLRTVSGYLAAPEVNSTYLDTVNVSTVLKSTQPSIGRLFDGDDFVSTLFLIKDDWVITARHSVNHSKLDDLSAMFGEGDFDGYRARNIAGVIESGEMLGLDYVVLKLSVPVLGLAPLSLTSNNGSTSLLFVGYNEDSVLRFSALPNSNLGQLGIVGYQETGASFSGSPYLDLEGKVCGIHASASTDQKTGIYMSTIVESNPHGALAQLIRGWGVFGVAPYYPGEDFQQFIIPNAIYGAFTRTFNEGKFKIKFRETGPVEQPEDDLSKRVFLAKTVSTNLFEYNGEVFCLGSDEHCKHLVATSLFEEAWKRRASTRDFEKEYKKPKYDATFNFKFHASYQDTIERIIKRLVDARSKPEYAPFKKELNYVDMGEIVGWDLGKETSIIELYYGETGSHIRPKDAFNLQTYKAKIPIIPIMDPEAATSDGFVSTVALPYLQRLEGKSWARLCEELTATDRSLGQKRTTLCAIVSLPKVQFEAMLRDDETRARLMAIEIESLLAPNEFGQKVEDWISHQTVQQLEQLKWLVS